MAITYIDFIPSTVAPFQFQAILDGTQYNIVVTYNIFGMRYYLNIYTTQGALVVSKPLVGSPTQYDISITGGYFTSTIVYRTQNKQFEISPTPRTYATNPLTNQPINTAEGLLLVNTAVDFTTTRLMVTSNLLLRIS